ncbi:hypothetical protein G7046_g2675 [Stylonectria norvegica]|nr:hypothetical protein G7046_g2675 [Stylonectria norvegica]
MERAERRRDEGAVEEEELEDEVEEVVEEVKSVEMEQKRNPQMERPLGVVLDIEPVQGSQYSASTYRQGTKQAGERKAANNHESVQPGSKEAMDEVDEMGVGVSKTSSLRHVPLKYFAPFQSSSDSAQAPVHSTSIAMTSPSLLDRLTSPRNQSPILPLHKSIARSRSRSSNEYDLDVLEPRPEPHASQSPRHAKLRKPSQLPYKPSSPSSSRDGKGSSSASPSRSRPKPMFAGPPPPIFVPRPQDGYGYGSKAVEKEHNYGLLRSGGAKLAGAFFDHKPQDPLYRPDTTWRALMRQEKALERAIQQHLDAQASGLIAGSAGPSSETDFDRGSDSGESTFYSTVSSKSRMAKSLSLPPRFTAQGGVIPVRQPAPRKPLGLRSARIGLRRSMAAMLELKEIEDAHVESMLDPRRNAIAYLDTLCSRRDSIDAELGSLEEDEQEPLGQQVRELGAQCDALDQEIHLMEHKLNGMRNRRRQLGETMKDVKERREAGLSGYRNARRDVDADVRALLQRPPVTPLDLEALSQGLDVTASKKLESLNGHDFLILRPDRRTVEMAKAWWKSEVAVLERRKVQILADQQALDEGITTWSEATDLVADFEASLRSVVKARQNHSEDSTMPQEVAIQDQLAMMNTVVAELEQKLQLAERKSWNLLICAIGAELEAFLEARRLLKAALGIDDNEPAAATAAAAAAVNPSEEAQDEDEDEDEDDGSVINTDGHHHQDESDNEVPADLLVSRFEEPHTDREPVATPDYSPQRSVILHREGTEQNDVPPEFLV